jgi:hypothetical protein
MTEPLNHQAALVYVMVAISSVDRATMTNSPASARSSS